MKTNFVYNQSTDCSSPVDTCCLVGRLAGLAALSLRMSRAGKRCSSFQPPPTTIFSNTDRFSSDSLQHGPSNRYSPKSLRAINQSSKFFADSSKTQCCGIGADLFSAGVEIWRRLPIRLHTKKVKKCKIFVLHVKFQTKLSMRDFYNWSRKIWKQTGFATLVKPVIFAFTLYHNF